MKYPILNLDQNCLLFWDMHLIAIISLKERFIKFNDVSADQTTDGLLSHVKIVVYELV